MSFDALRHTHKRQTSYQLIVSPVFHRNLFVMSCLVNNLYVLEENSVLSVLFFVLIFLVGIYWFTTECLCMTNVNNLYHAAHISILLYEIICKPRHFWSGSNKDQMYYFCFVYFKVFIFIWNVMDGGHVKFDIILVHRIFPNDAI